MIPKSFKAAIGFLTVFGLRGSKEGVGKEDIANSIVFFPIVGLLLGGICALAQFLLRYVVASDLVLSLFPVIILAVLTRGLHLDGVSDCFDALHFAGHNREKALNVMKGKAIGAFGASALIIVLVGKIVAISAIPEEFWIKSLLLIPSLSRWTSGIVARQGAPASAGGLGYIFTVYSTRKAVFISGAIALALSFLLLGMKGIAIFAFISAFALFLSSFFNRAFGGVTGDVFGAVLEISEVFGFLIGGIMVKS